MTVCVVIPAEAGIQRDGGFTLPITHHRFRLSTLDAGRWTLDWSYLTHHDLEVCVPVVRVTGGLEDTVPASSDG